MHVCNILSIGETNRRVLLHRARSHIRRALEKHLEAGDSQNMTHNNLKNRMIDYLAGQLTCKAVTEAITDYLEGNLGFMERMRFQMHLGFCRDCRRYLRQTRLTLRTFRHTADEAYPASCPRRTPSAIPDLESPTTNLTCNEIEL